MGEIKAHFIATSLTETGTNTEFRKLEVVVFAFLRDKFTTYSEESLLELAELHNKVIADDLFIKEDIAREDGQELNFDIKEEDDGYYIRFIDRPEIKLLRKLQAGSSLAFEEFCCKVLNCLGGTANVIGGKDDGGIDFVAYDHALNSMPFASTIGSKIVVIGQAKRYKDGNNVTEKELREFIGSSVKKIEELKRTRSGNYGTFQPTILAFWTTADFHEEGRKFAKEMGVWYLNGMALARLAWSLSIG